MTNFIGTESNDTANAALAVLEGFSGGGVPELQDGDGDFFAGGGGEDFIFAANAGDLIEGGEGHDLLNGGEGDDTIYGNTEPNPQGSAIGDEIAGNIGDDLIFGSNGGDALSGSAGDDTIFGNGDADILVGGDGRDSILGGDGNDTIYAGEIGDTFESTNNELDGGDGDDVVFGLNQFDHLRGGAGDDTLFGGDDSDFLQGGEGNDLLQGGDGRNNVHGEGGNDTIQVLQGEDAGELDFRSLGSINGGDGIDTFDLSDLTFDAVTIDLALGFWAKTATASEPQALVVGIEAVTGGSLDDDINGDLANNVLSGTGGDDILNGRSGNDRLNGGSGSDLLIGGAGNDTFTVDDQSEAVEGHNQGTDTVRSSVSYALGANLERLDLLGGGNLSGTGNAPANRLVGNSGANTLNGLEGSDVLTGNGGADRFLFTTALALGNVDTITDLQAGVDKIRVDNAIFTGLANGNLNANAFHIGSAAADATDRIIYKAATGALFFDADGVGGANQIRFATLDTGLALTAGDFFVI